MISRAVTVAVFSIASAIAMGFMSALVYSSEAPIWLLSAVPIPIFITLLFAITYSKWSRAYWGWKTLMRYESLLMMLLVFTCGFYSMNNSLSPIVYLILLLFVCAVPIIVSIFPIGNFVAVDLRGYKVKAKTPMAALIEVMGIDVWVSAPKHLPMKPDDKRINQLSSSIQARKFSSPLILLILGVDTPESNRYMSSMTTGHTWIQFGDEASLKKWLQVQKQFVHSNSIETE